MLTARRGKQILAALQVVTLAPSHADCPPWKQVFHQGFACNWHILEPVRKRFCYFDEEVRAPRASHCVPNGGCLHKHKVLNPPCEE